MNKRFNQAFLVFMLMLSNLSVAQDKKIELLVFIPKKAHSDVLEMIKKSPGMPFLDEPWENEQKTRAFGAWSIDKVLFDYILATLPQGKTLLECGSGWASGEFSKHYTVYSIEHDAKWLNKYNTNYIYAPIVNRWYNTTILKEKLPKQYDMILVDGPTGSIGRGGFYTNLHLFNTNVPIIFDDINRKPEYILMINVAKALNRDVAIFQSSRVKKFGVLLLDKE